MHDLLENSTLGDQTKVIFPNISEGVSGRARKTLYMALAHDIYLEEAQLNIEFNIEQCTQTTPAPSISTSEHEAPMEKGDVPHEQEP
jgi:hypothetical protein